MANLAYNINGQRVLDQRQDDLYVFGSSSAGNSIYFKEPKVLIDLGFSYKRYQEYDPNFFLKIDYLFLTHEHSDHLNPSTLMRVARLYPNVKIIMPIALWQTITGVTFAERLNQKKLLALKNRFILARSLQLTNRAQMHINFIPHVTKHGSIKNQAIELTYNNKHVLYASDLDEFTPNQDLQTQGLPMDPNNKFDILCLEANYDPDLLKQYIQTHDNSYRARENLRHIDEKTAWAYVKRFMQPNGIFIPLHASHTFGTLWQDYNGSYDKSENDS